MQENLPELRDIHLPDGVSFFPPAYGWWVILAIIISAILAYHLVRIAIKKSRKVFALKTLENIDTHNVVNDSVKISEILRRICVYKYKEAVTLTGKEWLYFLNSKSKDKISSQAAELLINAPYISKKSTSFSEKDLAELKIFMKDLKKISIKSGSVWSIDEKGPAKISFRLIMLSLIWVLLTLTVARPQYIGDPIKLRTQGRDILLVMDISTSMLEPDFAVGRSRVTRLNAVKKVATEFIAKRANDRIGLVLFGTRAYLQSPITFDKKSVQEMLMSMEAGMAGNSTAIGDAIGLALKTLRQNGNLEKKVIILLTDGENNDGMLSMQQAINLAAKEQVKTYTIGVGAGTSVINSLFGINLLPGNNEIDEKSLTELAEATKGKFFLAKDTQTLENIYNEINKIEATQDEQNYIQETQDLYFIPLLLALLLGSVLLVFSRRK